MKAVSDEYELASKCSIVQLYFFLFQIILRKKQFFIVMIFINKYSLTVIDL